MAFSRALEPKLYLDIQLVSTPLIMNSYDLLSSSPDGAAGIIVVRCCRMYDSRKLLADL